MATKIILFKLLTAEESGVISGGNSQFIPISQDEGRIVNVDGSGRNLNISTGEDKTNNNDVPINSLDISLLAAGTSQSQTRYSVR